MRRRAFLRGAFAGVLAEGVVIAATRAEIAAFASPLAIGAPLLLDEPPPTPAVQAGQHLYNAEGELVAIIERFHVTRAAIETTAYGDEQRIFVTGPPSVTIEAVGVAAVDWRAGQPYLTAR